MERRLKCSQWRTGCICRIQAIFGLRGLKKFFEGIMRKICKYSCSSGCWDFRAVGVAASCLSSVKRRGWLPHEQTYGKTTFLIGVSCAKQSAPDFFLKKVWFWQHSTQSSWMWLVSVPLLTGPRRQLPRAPKGSRFTVCAIPNFIFVWRPNYNLWNLGGGLGSGPPPSRRIWWKWMEAKDVFGNDSFHCWQKQLLLKTQTQKKLNIKWKPM